MSLLSIAFPLSSEMLWIVFALIQFCMFIITYRFFGKTGLFVWIAFSTIVANIQVVKTVELFGVAATLGNITYGTIFLASDVLNEKYGKQQAKQGVVVGFLALIVMTLIMQYALLFPPNEGGSDMQEALQLIFGLQWRIAVGSLAAFFISQRIDVWMYHLMKVKTKGRYLWLRSSVSTMVCQLIDTFIFCSIAFLGEMPASIWWQIFWTTYLLKFLVAAMATPFMYWARSIKPRSVPSDN
ncbi:queuosine precursor transporter [Aureibacillus halotolerans]|uniref:Probable queuosine precursor transporter n=1 Tax=Aureibacillus halotolerans TaxID=1508390 RepID=A0A4R6TUH3_9BACI|nr:queuosine precursor transporter [Aureibacillus halotolerans]TDQ37380.1 hypothetical protein EV213_11314 [Aureibacillus halotolerans]